MNCRTLLLSGGLGMFIVSLSTPLLHDPPRLHGSVNDRACQICHPGSTDGLQASVHAVLLTSPETAEQACSVCHGDLLAHRADPGVPVPAVPASACAACHDDQELPMRNFGKLLAVEHGDSSFRLHLQSITSSHLTSGHHIILNLSCYPGTETKALLRRKNSEQPWSMLPGLGTWEEGAEYDMVPASLEDFPAQ